MKSRSQSESRYQEDLTGGNVLPFLPAFDLARAKESRLVARAINAEGS